MSGRWGGEWRGLVVEQLDGKEVERLWKPSQIYPLLQRSFLCRPSPPPRDKFMVKENVRKSLLTSFEYILSVDKFHSGFST